MYVIKVNSSNTLVQASHYLQLMLISMLISMPKLALTKSECPGNSLKTFLPWIKRFIAFISSVVLNYMRCCAKEAH